MGRRWQDAAGRRGGGGESRRRRGVADWLEDAGAMKRRHEASARGIVEVTG
jgi:hypothetical protein